jgi:hypothetical protein
MVRGALLVIAVEHDVASIVNDMIEGGVTGVIDTVIKCVGTGRESRGRGELHANKHSVHDGASVLCRQRLSRERITNQRTGKSSGGKVFVKSGWWFWSSWSVWGNAAKHFLNNYA